MWVGSSPSSSSETVSRWSSSPTRPVSSSRAPIFEARAADTWLDTLKRTETMHPSLGRLTRQPLAAKVPEIAALFWILKLFTTAGGEAASDYLALHNVVVGGAVEI